MNNPYCKIALICLLVFSFNNVFAQTEIDTLKKEQNLVIQMNNGDKHKGNFLKKDGKLIILETKNGVVKLIASNVKSIEADDYIGILKIGSLEKKQHIIIQMNNGDKYKGAFLRKDGKLIILKTENGEVQLIASNVKYIEFDDYKGKFQFANLHNTRYFLGSSAIPIKKGTRYYQCLSLTAGFANYGVAKNLSIGGGFELITTLLGHPIWFLTSKLGFSISENIHLGGGFIMAGAPSEIFTNYEVVKLGYGVFTLGNYETNFSLGVGYAMGNNDTSGYPPIMLSGTHRISNKVVLLSENYILHNPLNEPVYLGVHGIRILSKQHAFDLGTMTRLGLRTTTTPLPYVGYARAF